MLNGRIARRLAAGASVSALAITLGIQSVSHAEPSIDEVQSRVDNLYHEAEVAQERLNHVRHQMQGTKDRLKSLRSDLKNQRTEVKEMGDVVAATVAQDAQGGGGFGATSELLFSDNPEEIINGIVASESFSQHQGAMLQEFATKSDKLELREQQVETEVAELAKDEEQVAAENEKVESKLSEAKEVLSELKAEERERLRRQREAAAREAAREAAAEARAQEQAQQEQAQQEQTEQQSSSGGESRPSGPETSRSAEREPVNSAPASGGAAGVVEFARSQVGDAYVYGANGPDSWDCSGLTTAAWATAGVSLPRSSSAQMGAGTSVSRDQLQPGDLVFYYSPVSHVGIYAGNGQLIHAANPGSGVEITSVDSMPFSGAVRPG